MAKQCNLEGCDHNQFGGGFCKMHQWKRPPKEEKTAEEVEWMEIKISQIPGAKINKAYVSRKAIARISGYRKKEEAIYKIVREEYLKGVPNCENCNKPATELHHKNGRNGKRIYDVGYFMSVCRKCHNWIHNNPKKARVLKYLY